MTLTQEIKKFFDESDRPVLFAGAGVSVRADLPTWEDYLRELAAVAANYDAGTKFMMDQQITKGRFDLAASYFFLCDIPQAQRLVDLAAPLQGYDESKLLELVSLPFSSVVTTNYDEALLDAYAAARGKAARLVNIDEPTLDAAPFEKKFYIARIHGQVQLPETIRLSREHFSALVVNESYKSFLTHILTRCDVMFVGFSFMDPAITAVMRSVKETYRNRHGKQHLALIPDGASANFLREVEAHDIRRLMYSPAHGHGELWEAIRDAVGTIRIKARTPVVSNPFELTKRYLATAYARMKLGGTKGGPLLQVMSEGMIFGIIRGAHSAGMSEQQLVKSVLDELPVSEESARHLVSASVTALLADGMCKAEKISNETIYIAANRVDNVYDDAIDRLVAGTVNRLIIRERGADSIETRQFLRRFFIELILNRGWDLGAAFAARRMPDDVDVLGVMRSMHDVTLGRDALGRLRRAVQDLLAHPDDAEAHLLSELGRLSFGLELLIQSPKDADFFERTLPDRIYLDANVLMPAITAGHPQKLAIEKTIGALQRLNRSSGAKIEVCVYEGFLNEIVSHRRLAIAAMAQRDGEGAMWAEREASLLGPTKVNVFIGAYFNLKESVPELEFAQFIKLYAPYEGEGELREFLGRRGYRVVNDNPDLRRDYPEILHALEMFYSTGLERQQKSARVVAHDAAQLALLSFDMNANQKSILVSADKSLRSALDQHGFAWLGSGIITHLGLVQLVDLLCGEIDESRSLASLYWIAPASSNSELIRNHLISLALKLHDAAYAMELKDVVDEVTEDANAALDADDLMIDTIWRDQPEDRVKMNNILGRYEADFFEKMRREIERREAKLKG